VSEGAASSGARWQSAHSAGGVVVRQDGSDYQLVVIKPRGQDRLQLPKGTIDRGETPEVTAVREVREETGIQARIIAPLGDIRYFFRSRGRGFRKQVDFYLMAFEGGDTSGHDHEVDEALWIPTDQRDRLTFESEREIVDRAVKLIERGDVSLG